MDANYANKMLICEICHYKCSRKADYERHLLTKKHLKNASKKACKTRKTRNIVDFTCKFCGMSYKHRPSLSRHLKKCKSVEFQIVDNANKMLICEKEANKKSVNKKSAEKKSAENPEEDLEKDMEIKDLKIQLLEEKLKHKDEIIGILKTNKGNTTNNNTQNFDNNTFNTNNISINLYLNEHCKDAMNLTDFVDQIKVQLEDIMYQDRTTSAAGLTNIITKQLKDLAPTERPIHCSDHRRQHFYIKEGEEWKQKTGDEEMEESVRKIQIKQLAALKEWEEEHPNFMDDERLQAKYTKFMSKIMYGCGDQVKMTKNVKVVKKNISQNIMIKDAIADLQDD